MRSVIGWQRRSGHVGELAPNASLDRTSLHATPRGPGSLQYLQQAVYRGLRSTLRFSVCRIPHAAPEFPMM